MRPSVRPFVCYPSLKRWVISISSPYLAYLFELVSVEPVCLIPDWPGLYLPAEWSSDTSHFLRLDLRNLLLQLEVCWDYFFYDHGSGITLVPCDGEYARDCTLSLTSLQPGTRGINFMFDVCVKCMCFPISMFFILNYNHHTYDVSQRIKTFP